MKKGDGDRVLGRGVAERLTSPSEGRSANADGRVFELRGALPALSFLHVVDFLRREAAVDDAAGGCRFDRGEEMA
jgi:hypothetical protein